MSVGMINEVILHFFGDVIFQKQTWFKSKTHNTMFGLQCCLTHCFIYATPFVLIASLHATVFIMFTHFIVDRYVNFYKSSMRYKDHIVKICKAPYLTYCKAIDAITHISINRFIIWVDNKTHNEILDLAIYTLANVILALIVSTAIYCCYILYKYIRGVIRWFNVKP